MSIKKMTVDEWISVSDNPIQRDTVVHAEKAKKAHLRTYSPTHASVAAAVLPGGRLVKLDGHTRALLWSQNHLERPPYVEASIYLVKNMDEAKELYTHFDSKEQTETFSDMKFGAFRDAGIDAWSGLVKRQNNASVFRKLAPKGATIYQIIYGWRREILLLDSVGFSKNSLKAGGILGSLVLLRCCQVDSVIRFLQDIQKNAGTKTRDGMDSVQMFRAINDRVGTGHSEDQIWTMAGRMVALYRTYSSGRRYVSAPPAIDVRKMLADTIQKLA